MANRHILSFIAISVLLMILPQLVMAGVRCGLIGGASFAKLSVDTDSKIGIKRPIRSGFSLGGILEVQISKRYSIYLEPIYAEKGSETDLPSPGDDLDNTLELNYLLFPIHLKVRFNYGKVNPYIFAGPYLGYASKLQMVMKNTDEVIDVKDEFRRSDLGVDIGAGTEIQVVKKLFIAVDGRYSIGLRDISAGSLSNFKNRGILVLAGILFKI